jgi:hypothetical protein
MKPRWRANKKLETRVLIIEKEIERIKDAQLNYTRWFNGIVEKK